MAYQRFKIPELSSGPAEVAAVAAIRPRKSPNCRKLRNCRKG